MSLNVRVDVDLNGVPDLLEEAIEEGIEDAGDEIAEELEAVAQHAIRDGDRHANPAVWRGVLLEAFTSYNRPTSGGRIVVVRNVAPHASYLERGVSGTKVKRPTPHQYTTKAPNPYHLLPWVADNMAHISLDSHGNFVAVDGGTGFQNFGDMLDKAYALSEKIFAEGLEAIRYMVAARNWAVANGHNVVAANVAESTKSHGF